MKKKLVLSLLLLILLTGCRSFILKTMVSKSVEIEVLYNKEKDKKLVLLPMVHLNHPEFFEDVKHKLDSLRDDGYSVFYETVQLDSTLYASKEIDTITRKWRKIVGFHLTKYDDSENKSLPRALRNNKYVAQTKKNIGLKKQDRKIDVPIDTLIQVFEIKYDEVRLSPCDFLTDLKAEYNCGKTPLHQRKYILLKVRNQYIENKVLQSKDKKIALVYGKDHFKELKQSFQNQGYQLKNKK
ncbi:hypothetical protein RBU60_02145 [Mesonia sp. MT50]|uniref:Lipoprotein n=1 Tax=Mesonia profundi TaxID=3070998 RepID=A0ABU1A0X0_9FLAO|nr:hypothetical protein [Mesonia profundi]MDQ7916361.1 hypothetical protein [Mesonia profundi]